MKRSTRLEVDLDLVSHNFQVVRQMLADGPAARDGAPPKLVAVLKGNAYGLGATAMARELLGLGADMLAVACLPEALELREAFPSAPILVMGHTPSEYFPDCARAGLRTTLFDLPQAEALSRASEALGTRTPVHVKLDTGMNRLGIKPDAGTAQLIASMASLPGLRLEGIFTQLAYRDRASDLAGFALFNRVVAEARAAGVEFPLHHVCESLGLMRYPEIRFDLVRIGAIFFGVKPLRTPLADRADIRTPFAPADAPVEGEAGPGRRVRELRRKLAGARGRRPDRHGSHRLRRRILPQALQPRPSGGPRAAGPGGGPGDHGPAHSGRHWAAQRGGGRRGPAHGPRGPR
jgi:alanine racemase